MECEPRAEALASVAGVSIGEEHSQHESRESGNLDNEPGKSLIFLGSGIADNDDDSQTRGNVKLEPVAIGLVSPTNNERTTMIDEGNHCSSSNGLKRDVRSSVEGDLTIDDENTNIVSGHDAILTSTSFDSTSSRPRTSEDTSCIECSDYVTGQKSDLTTVHATTSDNVIQTFFTEDNVSRTADFMTSQPTELNTLHLCTKSNEEEVIEKRSALSKTDTPSPDGRHINAFENEKVTQKVSAEDDVFRTPDLMNPLINISDTNIDNTELEDQVGDTHTAPGSTSGASKDNTVVCANTTDKVAAKISPECDNCRMSYLKAPSSTKSDTSVSDTTDEVEQVEKEHSTSITINRPSKEDMLTGADAAGKVGSTVSIDDDVAITADLMAPPGDTSDIVGLETTTKDEVVETHSASSRRIDPSEIDAPMYADETEKLSPIVSTYLFEVFETSGSVVPIVNETDTMKPDTKESDEEVLETHSPSSCTTGRSIVDTRMCAAETEKNSPIVSNEDNVFGTSDSVASNTNEKDVTEPDTTKSEEEVVETHGASSLIREPSKVDIPMHVDESEKLSPAIFNENEVLETSDSFAPSDNESDSTGPDTTKSEEEVVETYCASSNTSEAPKADAPIYADEAEHLAPTVSNENEVLETPDSVDPSDNVSDSTDLDTTEDVGELVETHSTSDRPSGRNEGSNIDKSNESHIDEETNLSSAWCTSTISDDEVPEYTGHCPFMGFDELFHNYTRGISDYVVGNRTAQIDDIHDVQEPKSGTMVVDGKLVHYKIRQVEILHYKERIEVLHESQTYII